MILTKISPSRKKRLTTPPARGHGWPWSLPAVVVALGHRRVFWHSLGYWHSLGRWHDLGYRHSLGLGRSPCGGRSGNGLGFGMFSGAGGCTVGRCHTPASGDTLDFHRLLPRAFTISQIVMYSSIARAGGSGLLAGQPQVSQKLLFLGFAGSV